MAEAIVGEINSFNVYGELAVLRPALQIAMGGLLKYKVRAWSQDQDTLILHWYVEKRTDKINPLFVDLDIDAAEIMIKTWLEKQEYGPAPRTDGSTGKGVHIYNDRWGRIDDQGSTSFIAIKPHWVIYGK